MDTTTLKIAIAGFLHDIGKFVDRGSLDLSEDYIESHAALYLPSFKGRYSHYHAVYTAAFIDKMSEHLPGEFNSAGWGEGDALINIASGHHDPGSPMQWIVAIADRLSSGWDRDVEDSETLFQSFKDYKKTRLLPLFEKLTINDGGAPEGTEGYSYAYPLQSISPQSIFCRRRAEITPSSSDEAEEEYRRLFQRFLGSLKKLKHKKENISLWFEHFDSLMMMYASHIPAARAGDILPDVSLYDHSLITAGIAAALYRYHRDRETLTERELKNMDQNKFLFVSGDFYGIQDFIFKGYGDTRKYRSKLLRGRSFAVSLICELAADRLCRELGLPHTSILMNAAGKFTLLAPNTEDAREKIKAFESTTNDWLIGISFGENTIGISSTEVSPRDLLYGQFHKRWDQIADAAEEKKCRKIDPERHAGPVSGYLDSFINDLHNPLCPICGKRPSIAAAEGSRYVLEARSSCGLCRDHIFLGSNLVKGHRLAIASADSEIGEKEERLYVPIFGQYQVFFTREDLDDLAESGKLFKLWEFAIPDNSDFGTGVSLKLLNGYVPVYGEEDKLEGYALHGRKSGKTELELADQIRVGEPKTLDYIATRARNVVEGNCDYRGIAALGVLKADIDDMGLLLASGLKGKRFTVSRLATLSRQFNYFFALYLPHLLTSDRRFVDTYTVFAGGDDLFLIGPWNRMVELARELNVKFKEYVCGNKNIHFSAGISLHKSHSPIDAMAEHSEKALEKSKSLGRNRCTLFSETMTWEENERLAKIKETLLGWIQKGWINNAMLYRFNELIVMAAQEKRVTRSDEIHVEDMSCARWRAILAYTAERNTARSIKDKQRMKVVSEVTGQMALWLDEYGGKLRVPLWDILYNSRR